MLVGTIQQTRRSALLGFDPFENPFDHHSRIRPQIWPQRVSQPPFWSTFFGREVSSKTEETLKIRRGSNERNMGETYHNPATRTKHTTVNESKHILSSSMILLHHTGRSQLRSTKKYQNVTLSVSPVEPEKNPWIFNGPWGCD